MRRVLGVVLLVVLASSLVATRPASADTVSVTQRVIIRAVILPATYVTVDSQGHILRIDSNTTEDINPFVYENTVKPGNQRPLTPAIMNAFRQLVPLGKNHVGVLYQRPQVTAINLTTVRFIGLGT
ncbi:MAG: hypothetical protein JWN38_627 [Candidatus Saccharibacteria bacterium]|nr:hypothetical protein [Candidatus Saccharibacteria bacterium]